MSYKSLIAPAIAAAIIAGLILAGHFGPADASGANIGIDADPAGNSATGLGSIETCRRVEVGQSFDVDTWIDGVTGLRTWELILVFDGSKVTVTAEAPLFFTGFSVNDELPDSDGVHYLGFAQLSQTGTSGTGVLARVTMEATDTGQSILGIQNADLNHGSDPLPVGTVSGGRIAIGQECSNATLPPTQTPPPTAPPPPSRTQTAAPTPTVTVAPTATATVPPQSATATPAPSNANTDCDSDIDRDDVVLILAAAAEIPRRMSGCPDVGTQTANGIMGDADCNGVVDTWDALVVLQAIAGVDPLPVC